MIRANLGVCSLATWEVSVNDTNWQTPPATVATVVTNLTDTDSLNQGGRWVTMFGVGTSTALRREMMEWKYARVVLRRKGDSGQIGDATLPGRIDSLRISYLVEFP